MTFKLSCRFVQVFIFSLCYSGVVGLYADDMDFDGIEDGIELANGLDPNIPDYLIATGWNSTCAKSDVQSNGGVSCWGQNSAIGLSVPAFSNLRQLAVGANHVCGLDDNGVQCWGDNGAGQISPPAMTGVIQISAFSNHTCAVHDLGVSCWGDDSYGQSTVPVLVNPREVAAGHHHSCAIDDNGITCWGRDADGRLDAPTLSAPIGLVAGEGHNCVIRYSGPPEHAICWGKDGWGQSTPPISIFGIAFFYNSLSVGQNMSCGVLPSTGSIKCWGANGVGQRTPPEEENLRQLTSGYQHSCVLNFEGAWCWGRSAEGQLDTSGMVFDRDQDGIANYQDNCLFVANVSQTDLDGDSIGDACDNDSDGDGFYNVIDPEPLNNTVPTTFMTDYVEGKNPISYFGRQFDVVDDVNGDGIEDFVVGSERDDTLGYENGAAYMISGADLSELYFVDRGLYGEFFGVSVSRIDDINRDGIDDFAASSKENNGTLSVYSGIDGMLLYRLEGDAEDDEFAQQVKGIGDVDNDGIGDIVIGISRSDIGGEDAGAVRILSGANGDTLLTIYGSNVDERLGIDVSASGDVNNDTYPDIMAKNNSNGVSVFSGVDGALLYSYAGESFGAINQLGDINLDSYDDFAISVSTSGVYCPNTPEETGGEVRVYSGSDGAILYRLQGCMDSPFATSVSLIGDINADGYHDIAVGAGQEHGQNNYDGAVYIYSGIDGDVLYRFGGVSGDRFGWHVDAYGSDNDPARGVLVGELNGGDDYGRVYRIYLDSDTDGDTMLDNWEDVHGLLKNNASDAAFDPDVDGLSNLQEFNLGTDPNLADTDNDGVNDATDEAPLNPLVVFDNDGDGLGDSEDIDDDNDAIPDIWELSYGLNPLDANDASNDNDADNLTNLQEYKAGADPLIDDTDVDGVLDGDDAFPLDNAESIDTDGDMVGNNSDWDDDGDGVADSLDSDPLNSTEPDLLQYEFFGDTANDRFGRAIKGAGDVNADGYQDFIIGAEYDDAWPGNGAVYVYSGANGSLLYQLLGDLDASDFGESVDVAGDVNGDGYSDIIVGDSRAELAGIDVGAAHVFSGADGVELYRYYGSAENDFFLRSVSSAGDVNRDGYADFVIGSSIDDEFGINVGVVTVYSGKNGGILYQIYGGGDVSSLGGRVSESGDVNADGYDDFMATYSHSSAGGSVRVYSGVDGSVLYALNEIEHAQVYESLSCAIAAAGDVNGDGYADIIAGCYINHNYYGEAVVFSGQDGAVLHHFIGTQYARYLGRWFTGIGDVNLDGYDDVVIATPHVHIANQEIGKVMIYSGVDGSPLYSIGDGIDAFSGGSYGGLHAYNQGLVIGSPGYGYGTPQGSSSGKASVYLLQWDYDSDGMPTLWEEKNGLDSQSAADTVVDSDGDGLTAIEEFSSRTNPNLADSDGDGIPDDGDDSDRDGLPNRLEIDRGLNPANNSDRNLPFNDTYRGITVNNP